MQPTIGVGVVAQGERAIDLAQPGQHRIGLGDDVQAGHLRHPRVGGGVEVHRAPRHRDGHATRGVLRGGHDPVPQVLVREVDRVDRGPPVQQLPQRTHLGAGTEHGHLQISEVKPLRMCHERTYCVREGRFGDPACHPVVELPVQVVAGQPVSLVRHGELGPALVAPDHLEGVHPFVIADCQRREQRSVTVPGTPHEALVQRVEARLGDRQRCLRVGDRGHNQVPDRRQIPRAPVLDHLNPARRGRVDPPQRVGDDRPTRGRGAAGPVVRGGEVDTGLHGGSMYRR